MGSHPVGSTDYAWQIKTSTHVVPVGPPIWVSQHLSVCLIPGRGNMGGVSQFVCTQAPRPEQSQPPQPVARSCSPIADSVCLVVPMNAHPEPTP